MTLRDENLLWLKGRTLAAKGRSLSETLDSIVTAARTGVSGPHAAVRSVAGTIDIAADDPDLVRADDYIRDLVDDSLRRPAMLRESPAPYRPSRSKTPRRG